MKAVDTGIIVACLSGPLFFWATASVPQSMLELVNNLLLFF